MEACTQVSCVVFCVFKDSLETLVARCNDATTAFHVPIHSTVVTPVIKTYFFETVKDCERPRL